VFGKCTFLVAAFDQNHAIYFGWLQYFRDFWIITPISACGQIYIHILVLIKNNSWQKLIKRPKALKYLNKTEICLFSPYPRHNTNNTNNNKAKCGPCGILRILAGKNIFWFAPKIIVFYLKACKLQRCRIRDATYTGCFSWRCLYTKTFFNCQFFSGVQRCTGLLSILKDWNDI
jgi:hypothetical protein